MKNIFFLLITGILISVCNPTQAQKWALQGDYAEGCSCTPLCSCPFGSGPSLSHCHTIMLVQINRGHYGNVDLSGIDAVVVFRLDDWARVYVSDKASDKQVTAARKLIFNATYLSRIGDDLEVKSTEKTPITVDRRPKKVVFSTPYSKVDIESIDGPTGKPIKIINLGRPDFTEFKTREFYFNGKEEDFQYTGTSGYTATLNKFGED